MDLNQRIQILIGGDASQAKRVIKEVESELAASSARQEQMQARSYGRQARNAGQAGARVGDAFGRQFNRVQDRYLGLAESGLRRWGGTFGAIVADALAAFGKIDNAAEATERYNQMQGGGNQSNGSNLAETAIAARVGVRTPLSSNNGRPSWDRMEFRARSIRYKNWFQKQNSTTQDAISNGLIDPTLLTGFNKSMSNRLGFVGDAAVVGIQSIKNFFGSVKKIAQTDLSPVLKFIGGSTGAVIAATVASIVGVIQAFKKLGDVYDDIMAKTKSLEANRSLIKSIEDIKDPTERAAAILAKFGDDGLEAFRKLKEETNKLQKELAKDEGWSIMSAKGKAVTEGLSEFFTVAWNGIKKSSSTAFSYITNLFSGISDELAQGMVDTKKSAIMLQRKLDDKTKSKISDDKLKKQLQEEENKSKSVEVRRNELIDDLRNRKPTNDLKSQIEYQKKLNELSEIDKQLAEEKVKIEQDRLGLIDDQTNARIKMIDQMETERSSNVNRARLSISDLAGYDTVFGQQAKKIQQLEEQIKAAYASGDLKKAVSLNNQAVDLRNALGATGIIKMDEYGDEIQKFKPGKSLPSDKFYLRDAILKYGEQFGKRGREMKAYAQKRQLELLGMQDEAMSLDKFFKDNGYLPVKPRNGK